MKKFSQFYTEREASIGLGDLSMHNLAPDETLLDVAKIAIKKHKEKTLEFFHRLAQDDTAIKNELNRYENDRRSYRDKADDGKFEIEPDIIAPNNADSVSDELS